MGRVVFDFVRIILVRLIRLALRILRILLILHPPHLHHELDSTASPCSTSPAGLTSLRHQYSSERSSRRLVAASTGFTPPDAVIWTILDPGTTIYSSSPERR
ncbi:hypothetical protein E4U41_005330 [Claviceps citrina]|nr:hypothetical protein E4U41_005330 [Claviceps citrina]